jgi:hypothetical protein
MVKLVINIDSYLSLRGNGLRPLAAVSRYSGFYRSAAGEPVVKSALITVAYGRPFTLTLTIKGLAKVSGSYISVSGKLTLAVSPKNKALRVSNRVYKGLRSLYTFYPLKAAIYRPL